MDRKILIYSGLTVILFGAAFLRLYKIASSPPALNWDEAALGYNAYSLLQTGRDEYGYPMPLSLRSFDDYKPAVYAYTTVPVVKLLGLSETAVRLTSAVAGILSVLTIFIIATQLFGQTIGLIAALLIATEPWSVMFSRSAFESNLSLLFTLLGISLLIRAFRDHRWYPWALAMATLNIFVYHSAKIYLLLLVIWIFYKTKKWSLFTIICLGVLGLQLWAGSGLARFSSTSIFSRFTQNFSEEIVNRYFSYYSPANLFVRGSNEPNQKLPSFSLFYTWEFFLFVPGLIILSKHPLYLWYLGASIPAILTWNWFSPIRVLPLWAITSVINAHGLYWWYTKNKLVFLPMILFVLCTSTALLGIDIWLRVPYLNYGDWQWGFKQVITAIKPTLDQYDQVVWDTSQAQPHIFALFYLQYPPDQYHRDIVTPESIPSPRKNFDFGKFKFRKIYWPTDRDLSKTLFIGGVYGLPLYYLEGDKAAFTEIVDPQGYVTSRIVPRP